MSGNVEGRIGKLERERGKDAGGIVVMDERFSFTRGAWPSVDSKLVVRIEDPWAWESSEANHGLWS